MKSDTKIVWLSMGSCTEGLAMAAFFEAVRKDETTDIACAVVDGDASIHERGWFDTKIHYPADILPLRELVCSANVICLLLEVNDAKGAGIVESICLEAGTDTATVVIGIGTPDALPAGQKAGKYYGADVFIPIRTRVPLSNISAEQLVDSAQRQQVNKATAVLHFFQKVLSASVNAAWDVGTFIKCLKASERTLFVTVTEKGSAHSRRAIQRACASVRTVLNAFAVTVLVEYCPTMKPDVKAIMSEVQSQHWVEPGQTSLTEVHFYDKALDLSETRISLLVIA